MRRSRDAYRADKTDYGAPLILINCLSALQGGGQTYLLHLFSFVPEPLRQQVVLIAHRQNEHLWKPFGVSVITAEWASTSLLHRVVWENVVLPSLIKRLGASVYFAPGGILPFRRFRGVKMVTMFRNMLPFTPEECRQYPWWAYMRWRLFLLRHAFIRSFKKADLIIFLSRYAREKIDQLLPERQGDSVIIPHGLTDLFRERYNQQPPPGIRDKYVLYVSTLDIYKSQLDVLRSWSQVCQQRLTREKLVFIGPAYPPYAHKVNTLIKELHLEDNVLLLGKIPYEELPRYYQHAEMNLFASSCENCPNILLEALAAGKPVLCSNYPPMPEFAGNGALYFDPHTPEELAALLLKYLDDEYARQELGKKAFQHSLPFQWKETASRTWELLAGAIGERTSE